MFSLISRIIEKAAKFETRSQTNIVEKLEPFLEICDISKVVSPSSGAEEIPPSPKRPESPLVEEELGRGKRLKVGRNLKEKLDEEDLRRDKKSKVRRNLDKKFENFDNIESIEDTVENDSDYTDENDADTEESDEETEWKPKKRKKRAKKQERPQYQNTLDLLWGRFRASVVLIALVINTVCQ